MKRLGEVWRRVGSGVRHLEIFVLPHCAACRSAAEIAELLAAAAIPGVNVAVADLSRPDAVRSPRVFAAPTYILDGRVISLGNPDIDWLLAKLSPGSRAGETAP